MRCYSRTGHLKNQPNSAEHVANLTYKSNRKKVSSGVVVDDGNTRDKTRASLNVGNSNYMQQVSWKGHIGVQTRKWEKLVL